MGIFPEKLNNRDALELLIEILKEKDAQRRQLKSRRGKRVKNPRDAKEIFSTIKKMGDEFLGLRGQDIEPPSIVLKEHLGLLPKKAVKLHVLYWAIGSGILLLNSPILEPGAASWMVKGSVVFLFAAPTLISRRVKLNLEHECGYVNVLGKGTIYIHQLPVPQFHSYIAHEYAHHLFFFLARYNTPRWQQEGWARLFQWELMKRLFDETGDAAYLVHVLEQVVGELKFACQLLAAILLAKIPWKIRGIPTMYNRNPLWRILTGWPSFNVIRLIDHSVGTAAYFWAERKMGIEEMLKTRLFLEFR